ncbi:hypothetical protein KC325_g67 [Hortaea werneckii]|nr:hypothetical protein KC325_g67 [Hortaea werneckii]
MRFKPATKVVSGDSDAAFRPVPRIDFGVHRVSFSHKDAMNEDDVGVRSVQGRMVEDGGGMLLLLCLGGNGGGGGFAMAPKDQSREMPWVDIVTGTPPQRIET